MRISELQEKWDSISPLSGGFLLASGNHPLAFHIGYYNGSKTFIVVNTGEISKINSSKAINVECIQTKKDEFSLRFTLLYETLEELFIKLCRDLIEFTKESENPVPEIMGRYNNWLRLFQIVKDYMLSSNVQKGLIGELLYLKELINTIGEDNALTAWVGPEGSDQDFLFENSWSEVKAVSIAATEVMISSLQQLDRSDEGKLLIYFMDKTSSDSANTKSLYSVYNDVLASIQQKDNLDIFSCKLAKYGLMEKDIKKYEEFRYNLAERRDYCVNNKFPRLIRNNIPVEISSAKYGIDLATIDSFKIEES